MSPSRLRLLFVLGTRPEVVKLAPVIRAARTDSRFSATLLHSGQHLELADEMFRLFDLKPDISLSVMEPNQSLFSVSARILERLAPVFATDRYDMIVIQGDTTTAFLGALAGYYTKTPVAHVEAGLRTFDRFSPFPEEMNRRLAGALTELHFPPTEAARQNLLREGFDDNMITVTGNTVIDALLWALELPYQPSGDIREILSGSHRLVLVTSHRRESFGEPHRRVFKALRTLADKHADIRLLFPVHPNPNVRAQVAELLGHHPRITLCAPLGYLDFINAMKRATLILSDSGGVQEEAPTLKKPVLVLRDHTERPEGLSSGALRLVGTDDQKILTEADRLLTDPAAYQAMTKNPNPYGDGKASERILDAISRYFSKRESQTRA
ncbi:MAG TPA: UDP-N-acetylglucosamine 2-epimerase (non-hydrolyzing) [Candidatus Ozemobacteraceae bacterium]|nr:UDP-N-acetylglucosamine 2-epimerase (non-hydrolyzing) [Candidatus Ozemobacteraceae bacterium]